MKDGAEGAEVYSRLDVVEVGTEDEGEPITTCVVVPEDESAPSRARVSGQTAVAIEQLQTALAEGGRDVPASDHIHRTKRAVRLDLWRTYFDKAAVVKSDKPDSRLKAFKRAVEGLQTRGLIGVSDDWVWIQDKPDKAGQR